MKQAFCFMRISKHCSGRNGAVRMLMSAKGLISLQSKMAQNANAFRLDKKAKEKDLPRTFEDHVKSVEELLAFLSNHEQGALESSGKRKTNGPDMTIPRCTQQSFLIVLEQLASFTNTLTQIGHSHLASGQDLPRKYDNFGHGMLFQRIANRPRHAYSG